MPCAALHGKSESNGVSQGHGVCRFFMGGEAARTVEKAARLMRMQGRGSRAATVD